VTAPRVAVIGNMRHAFCTESYFARAFAENGCDVVPMQVDDVVHDADAAMAMLRTCSAATYTRTHAPGRYLDQRWTQRWAELERCGTRTIGLHLDRFFDLERESLVHDGDAQFTCDQVWTADGGSQDRFERAGVNHRWLVPAIDRAQAEYDGRTNPRMEHDVIFVGSGPPYHEDAYPERGQLIAHLHRTYGTRFAHYGHGGGQPVVREHALSDLYRSAKVVVGDGCFANSGPEKRVEKYWSDRVPESVGRGAFLIHPWVPGLAEHMDTGRDYVTHIPGDWNDLDAQIGAYLCAPGERAGIAQQGRARVLREHTWTRRLADVLASVDLAPAISGDRVG
jgi:hypothetical protein